MPTGWTIRRNLAAACVRLAPVGSAQPRVGVVGHVEWVQFARVPHVPRAGEVVHAREPFEEPAGGGAVAAVQLARLAGEAVLVTALGEDEHGRRSVERLHQLGVDVRASWRAQPTRRAVTLVDDARERTITTLGSRLEPQGADGVVDWETLEGLDAIYFTAGDPDALRAARKAARVLVASPRARHALGHGVELDALVLSTHDEVERHEAARSGREAALVVLTDGARGGSYRARSGETGSWAAASPPGNPVDSYGCGDSFAAGLTYGLGAGLGVADSLALAARCGAACLTGSGPYERQLGAGDLKG
ncbi:MAG: ribokinase [Actinobacteria bacterium]|nr:MAG: ribokinase [Actinomycetota bacterium]